MLLCRGEQLDRCNKALLIIMVLVFEEFWCKSIVGSEQCLAHYGTVAVVII